MKDYRKSSLKKVFDDSSIIKSGVMDSDFENNIE